jgi:hypothetical protein
MKATLGIFLVLALALAGCIAVPPTEQPAGGIGIFNDNTVFQHDLAVGGNLTVTGDITGGSFEPSEFSSASTIYADAGVFTTTLTLAGTPVARVSGDGINATSLKVGATAVALQAGSAIDATSLKVAATPVVVQVGALAAGAKIICGSTTITGTGTLPTTLATPQYVNLTLGQDVTGNCQSLSYTNASATVTAKCFNSALTPAPATTPVAVNWCVIGK